MRCACYPHPRGINLITPDQTTGTYPGYDQPDDGQEEIYTASVTSALEWGLFKYSKEVMDNYLTHFVRTDGTIRYRGLEMAQQGRILTTIALYFKYTEDSSLILKHLEKIWGIAALLLQRYELSLSFPKNDSRHGMPTGLDETDMW